MPIQSRLPPDSGFDPETIRLLTSAFEEAWRALDRTANVGPEADAARDKLARLIIASAEGGERNPVKLRDAAIAFFRLAQGDKPIAQANTHRSEEKIAIDPMHP
jgi:hypothetical protein